MLIHPNFDPIAFSFGKHNLPLIGEISLDIRWYGLMYIIGFAAAWALGNYRAKKPNSLWTKDQVSDVIFYSAVGVVVGGRVGYTLFYNFGSFIDNPISIFQVWNGGMSFHGGFIGVLTGMFLFGKKTNKSFFEVADFVAPLAPLGLAAGRMGNFINGELWGRISDVPWAMKFHNQLVYRHPSQLYEFALEGILLFIILWFISSKKPPKMAVSALFSLLYGAFRFFVEFFREADAHIGYAAGWITRGQMLCFLMIIIGAFFLWLSFKNNNQTTI